MPEPVVRKTALIVEEIFHEGGPVADKPLRRAAMLCVIKNPFAGSYVEDIAGFMDDLKVSQVNAFANALVDYFNSAAKAVRDELAQARAISKELEPKLLSAINDFKQGWTE